jgi:chemotaxis protein MotB
MKKLAIALFAVIVLASCGTKKKIAALEAKNKEVQDLLNTATVKLNTCLAEKDLMNNQISYLKSNNESLKNSLDNVTLLSSKGASSLEKTLESIKEKDLRITRLQDAVTRKDSMTIALVSSLKSAVGIDDPDIEVNVEKGVVFISIADKLLFKSGSYEISDRARVILGKVAKVVNSKPDFECMVEGHTDSVPYNGGNGVLIDNWDLSAKRATAVIRVLQKEHKVNPKQLIAAGRGEYVPLVDNSSAENRSKNRRTRVIVLPKIDQFYDMIEKEMKGQK